MYVIVIDLHALAILPSIAHLPAASSEKWAGWQEQEGTEFRHNLRKYESCKRTLGNACIPSW